MSLKLNLHDIEGTVVKKTGNYPIGNNGMNKQFLYLSCKYLWKGQESEQILKFVMFNWGDNPSKIRNVFPGDEVSFTFMVNGRMSEEKKDHMGLPSVWNELIPVSKVEILSTQNRTLYNNEPKPEDGLASEPPTSKFKFDEGSAAEEKDDPLNDLPFA